MNFYQKSFKNVRVKNTRVKSDCGSIMLWELEFTETTMNYQHIYAF